MLSSTVTLGVLVFEGEGGGEEAMMRTCSKDDLNKEDGGDKMWCRTQK